MISCIILANTVDIGLYGMTQRTINTLRWSEPDEDFEIVVVESNKNRWNEGFIYDPTGKIMTVVPDEPFGYNAYLNHGLKHCHSDWIIIANNDLIFTQGWLSEIFKFDKQTEHKFRSFSPWEPNWHLKRGMDPDKIYHEGFRPAYEITGWCLVMRRELIETCKLFDPDFKYWYQDNDYALTLQKYGYRHALVRKSRVYHMVSASLDTLDPSQKHHMTDGQIEVLKRKWGPNV